MIRSIILLLFLSFGFFQNANGQFLIEMIDTSSATGKMKWTGLKKFDNLSITGYFQPQFQIAQEKGVKSFNAGDFAEQSNNRFIIRRGRVRFDYQHFTDEGKPLAQLVLQFDGSERGVNIRDFWGRFYENRFELFSFTTGMFARPFGFEINYSSQVRESPERGRMSQILMRTERDLGMMVSFEPRRSNHPLRKLKWDLGLFNGQGVVGEREFDSYKDIISRLSLKPYYLNKTVSLTGGLSLLHGGLANNSRYVFDISQKAGVKYFQVDSSISNYGAKSPRKYYGVDFQTKYRHGWGATEIRAEYWWGKQTGYLETSETPAEYRGSMPFYRRNFNGIFLIVLQNIINKKNQIGVKYDFYDPNSDLKAHEINEPGLGHSYSDIKFKTLMFGFNKYFSDNLKMFIWYDIVRNESTGLNGYKGDVRDNVLTCRLQYTF